MYRNMTNDQNEYFRGGGGGILTLDLLLHMQMSLNAFLHVRSLIKVEKEENIRTRNL